MILWIDLIKAIQDGFRISQTFTSPKLYVFDFDNTLVRTAEKINSENSYVYDIDELEYYENMVNSIKLRIARKNLCIVLSARNPRQKDELSTHLLNKRINVPVFVVRHHWIKAITLIIPAVMNLSKRIIVVDDMLYAEETGGAKSLFFPRKMLPKNVHLITGKKVLKLR